jgi:V8-like Glu-specific endopeptidase
MGQDNRFLLFDERRALSQVLMNLSVFTDGESRDRRVFLEETAGLGRFVPSMKLSSLPGTVVPDLIGRCEKFGELPERPGYHALGALLDAVLSLGELSIKDSAMTAGLVIKYALVADPGYISSLRAEHQLDLNPVRVFESEYTAPLPSSHTTQADIPFQAAVPDEAVLEEIIHSEDNFLDINFLYGAIYGAQAVCLIEIPKGEPVGTGFLINHDILLTNQHVIKNINYLEEAVARFEFLKDSSAVRSGGRVIKILPDLYESSPQAELDYALVRLESPPLDYLAADLPKEGKTIKEFVASKQHRGYLSLQDRFIRGHERVNIVQHPNGDAMKVVLTQNYVVSDMTETRVQYVADTMKGSSGSPVFNQKWEVVALHHSGGPYPPDSPDVQAKKAWKGQYRVNEGIPVRAILKDLRDRNLIHYLGE